MKFKKGVLQHPFEGLISASSHKGVSVPVKLGLTGLFRLCKLDFSESLIYFESNGGTVKGEMRFEL